jgi:hypothetical protein
MTSFSFENYFFETKEKVVLLYIEYDRNILFFLKKDKL